MDKFDTLSHLGCSVRVDHERAARTACPEVVFAESKSLDQIVTAVQCLIEKTGFAAVSRCPGDMVTLLEEKFGQCATKSPAGRTLLLGTRPEKNGGGKIGIISAGTSDIEVAEEARIVCEACGCEVSTAYDVGVAGIHRLTEPLRAMAGNSSCSVIIVAAGMDGALPSVVAGLVDVPVIGIPTSVGYGYGGAGTGALMAMLQSCAPGLAVVNIDNGVGAAAVAAKMIVSAASTLSKNNA